MVCADTSEGMKAIANRTMEKNEVVLRNAAILDVLNLKLFPPNPDLDEPKHYL